MYTTATEGERSTMSIDATVKQAGSLGRTKKEEGLFLPLQRSESALGGHVGLWWWQ